MDNNSRDINMEKRIDAYIKGHLTEEEAERLWIELLKQPEYIDLLDTELHVRSIIERRKQQSPVHFAGRYWKWIAAAACVGILVVALNFLTGSEDGEPLVLTSINMVEHLASPEIVRAEKSILSDADSVLNNGFMAAISGEAGRALQAYEQVISTYPDNSGAVSRAYFNIGIICFNDDRYNDASIAFNKVLQQTGEDRFLEEKAQWFLASAYMHLNEIQKAREAVEQVYSMDGIYRAQASRLLKRLDEISAGEVE